MGFIFGLGGTRTMRDTMIRIKYNNNEVHEYPNVRVAQFMLLNRLFLSQGRIFALEAADVFGKTMTGVIVERPLVVKLGMVVFNEW